MEHKFKLEEHKFKAKKEKKKRKKRTLAASLLIEPTHNNFKWKYLHIFYLFRPACIFAWGTCQASGISTQVCQGSVPLLL